MTYEEQFDQAVEDYARASGVATAAIERREVLTGMKYPEGSVRKIASAIVNAVTDDPVAIADIVETKMIAIEAEISARG